VAEIPVQPKRGPETPVQPKRRSVLPWVLGVLALLFLAVLFVRNGRDDSASLSDTAAFADTATRFGGRTTGTAGGAIAPSAATPGAGGAARSAVPTRRDTVVPTDTAAPADTAARPDTTRRP
jgi:hypothetical protein